MKRKNLILKFLVTSLAIGVMSLNSVFAMEDNSSKNVNLSEKSYDIMLKEIDKNIDLYEKAIKDLEIKNKKERYELEKKLEPVDNTKFNETNKRDYFTCGYILQIQENHCELMKIEKEILLVEKEILKIKKKEDEIKDMIKEKKKTSKGYYIYEGEDLKLTTDKLKKLNDKKNILQQKKNNKEKENKEYRELRYKMEENAIEMLKEEKFVKSLEKELDQLITDEYYDKYEKQYKEGSIHEDYINRCKRAEEELKKLEEELYIKKQEMAKLKETDCYSEELEKMESDVNNLELIQKSIIDTKNINELYRKKYVRIRELQNMLIEERKIKKEILKLEIEKCRLEIKNYGDNIDGKKIEIKNKIKEKENYIERLVEKIDNLQHIIKKISDKEKELDDSYYIDGDDEDSMGGYYNSMGEYCRD